MMLKACLAITLIASLLWECGATPQSDASQQVLELLQDENSYNRLIRPPNKGPTQVAVNTYIRHLDVDDVNMMLSIDLTFRMKWRDQRIRYTPDVDHIRLTDYSMLWTPDPFFKQSLEVKQHTPIHKEAYVRIDKIGNIYFSTRFLVKTRCPMDLQRFPHDVQDCKLLFASYGLTAEDIVFNWDGGNPIQQSDNIINADRYVANEFTTHTCDSRTATGEYSCLGINMELSRVFRTYLLGWYIPVFCLVCVALCSQLLPLQKILPRLIVTIAPFMTLYASIDPYITQTRAPVSYATAFDVFTGMSFIAIFATLLHSIMGHYYVNREPKKEDIESPPANNDTELAIEAPKSEDPPPKWHKVRDFVVLRADVISRASIAGGYALFIFLYLLAYSS